MKKIGLVTLYRDNFGSILQAYSTYSYVEKCGACCKIISATYDRTIIDKIKRLPFLVIKSIRYPEFFINRMKMRKLSKLELNLLSENTQEKMSEFVEEVFLVEKCNIDKLAKLDEEFDFFITGSDQVWNGYNSLGFLTFTSRDKKITLAPSFGTKNVKTYYRNDVKKALNEFDFISVREESGEKIVRELTGKEAYRLPDPTLIMSKKQWREFAQQGIQEENYILLHFLNKPNKVAIETINSFWKKYNCRVFGICNDYEEYEELANYQFIDISPYDYVSLIEGAMYVFTDSFHSTLFSLNLETQFLTFERQYLHGNSQSSRIIDLLRRVDMSERFVEGELKFNFEEEKKWNSDSLFNTERYKIRDYLKKSIEG